jgi:hypothetical protein
VSDSNEVLRGFVRSPDGTIVEFDIPGDVNGIISSSINNDGIVVGYFKDASLAQHVFMRAVSGEITVLDEPSGNGSPLSTVASSIIELTSLGSPQ